MADPAQHQQPDRQCDQRIHHCAGQREIEALPQAARAHFAIAGAVVLRHKRVDVTGDAHGETEQGKGQHTRTGGGRGGCFAVMRQHDAITEMHDRKRAHREDERAGHAHQFAIAARPRGAAQPLRKHRRHNISAT
jgi:hypothetical protein